MSFEQFELLENWLPVPGYEGYYEVSDWGRVRSVARFAEIKSGANHDVPCLRPTPGKLLQLSNNKYERRPSLYLCKKGKSKRMRVHVLVILAFVGPRPLGMVIDHIDADPRNNILANLRYITPRENQKRIRKISDEQIVEIRHLYFEGVTQRLLAQKFGVSQANINAICKLKDVSQS